ncbi:NAD(P)-dependent alcohol dehydrogenase [Jannaschia sp. W003]|uniref:NAD(P)-dependent alcohol dehydrogenase n=1 Tax=Jannaschia sp. W003 TaxID=2867012 RepID=UPI0021A6C050|nr:NAD(P)-dependent alcohol dehydrogenase [Jannaschia sp. W003]UWQ22663.1 NAD(P)-dependent alcohol dehydrogenase [Jannaschia sp. W003]
MTYDAWEIRRYGGPERLAPVVRPLPEPGPGEVLVRVRASAVTRADTMMRAGRPRFARLFLGLRRPRAALSGTGLSGEVIAAGPGVRRFAVGDAVFGEAGMRFGANASHILLPEDGVLMPKPDALTHEEAAVMCDGPLTSWHFLTRVAELRAGEGVLVLGGSGSLGSAAVQIAAALGADTTATTTRNAAMVAAVGAHRVVDPRREDVFAGGPFDVVFDTLGLSGFAEARPHLAPRGRYLCPVLGLALLRDMARSRMRDGPRALFSAAGLQDAATLRGGLAALLEMVHAGTFAPQMDRIYPLRDLVEAHRYVETGRKRGNVAVV